jgi:uncharacterized protein YkwD
MLCRGFALIFILGWFTATPGAAGQVVEEEDAERVEFAAKPKARGPDIDTSQVAKMIVNRTIVFRQEQGRERVRSDPELTETARYFANYMAEADKYGHTADGNRPAERAEQHGYAYCIILENIAYQYSSAGFAAEELARRFFEGWKGSPGHRKNMLDPDVTETGVAVAQSPDTGYYYAVQMFGRPKSQAIEFKVANESDAAVEYRIGERTFPLSPRSTRTHLRCRPAELTFQLPDGKPDAKGETKTVQPGTGDRFVVVGDKGAYRVKKD